MATDNGLEAVVRLLLEKVVNSESQDDFVKTLLSSVTIEKLLNELGAVT